MHLELTFLLVCKPEPATHAKKDKHQNVVTMVTYWVVRLKHFCLLTCICCTLHNSHYKILVLRKSKYFKKMYVQKRALNRQTDSFHNLRAILL